MYRRKNILCSISSLSFLSQIYFIYHWPYINNGPREPREPLIDLQSVLDLRKPFYKFLVDGTLVCAENCSNGKIKKGYTASEKCSRFPYVHSLLIISPRAYITNIYVYSVDVWFFYVAAYISWRNFSNWLGRAIGTSRS